MKKIAILGSTGSIGLQTLDVIKSLNSTFQVVGLAAGENIKVLEKQILDFKPRLVSVNNASSAQKLKRQINGSRTKILCEEEGLNEIASCEADLVLVAISGTSALLPTLTAIKNKKTIALATKEVLVAAGDLVMKEARKNKVNIIPVDSEHNAVFQILYHQLKKENIKRIILTASGGPFLKRKNLSKITAKQALNHPNWNMGKKITIDSATLMNKGLEVIEAHHLFETNYDKIEVIIHSQSIIHSMVEAFDNSVFAQLSSPDMRIPIQYALTYPNRIARNNFSMDFARIGKLTFEKPDLKKFPCLRLAYQAGRSGGIIPCVLNAANEAAVELFLQNKINFLDIPKLVEKAINNYKQISNPSLEEILEADKLTRVWILDQVKE